MTQKMELYKAVKYQVETYMPDHGYTLVDLWKVVNDETEDDAEWWKAICLEDYRERE